MIQAALFDMDGVILNSEPIHDRIWKNFFEGNGVPVSRKDLDSMRGVPVLVTIQKFMPHVTDQQRLQELHDERTSMLAREFEEGRVPLVDGITEFMYKLREEHIHIAVATSTKRTIAVEILQKVGVYTLVDVLVGGDEIIKGKPNPEIFLTAAERLDVAPENCIVFEDSLAGVQAGLKAHMHVVAMLTSHRKEEFPEVKQTLHDFVGVGVKSFLEEIVR